MKKGMIETLGLIVLTMASGLFFVGTAEAKTVTKIYKENPGGSSFKIRMGGAKKLKVILYTDSYVKPDKKIKISKSNPKVVSVGSVKYKKLQYTSWYGKKIIRYRATVKVTPKKIGNVTLTLKTRSGEKAKWKIHVRTAFTKQMAEGELGFIKWMLKKEDLDEARREDLNQAKRILELASKEKISAWLPELKDGNGQKIKDGITLDCSKKTDAAYISRLHANYKAYKELIKMQGKDAYYKRYMKEIYGDSSALDNGGYPYTNFKTVVGSMVDEDRFDIYHHHNPKWGRISADYNSQKAESYEYASSEVWAGSTNAGGAVDMWFGERSYVDAAVKSLGYNKKTITYDQLKTALKEAGNNGVIGHYTFCLFANHRDILGFASSSGGSLGHSQWYDDEDQAKYTFKEMDDYVTAYLDEIGY